MKTLILIAFLSMTAFAQDANQRQLRINKQIMELQDAVLKANIKANELADALYFVNMNLNPETSRSMIDFIDRIFTENDLGWLKRNLPPIEPEIDLKEFEVPLKEVNETD